MKPFVGLALMHESEFLQAALPLFVSGEVDIVEWSFDAIAYEKYKPKWLHKLLQEYSSNNRLIGHGVRYSLFDAKWTGRQQLWLNKLKKELRRYQYRHITEHFGFMTSSDFHKGAPLPVSFNQNSLQLGIDRIRRLKGAVGPLSVGIENLAFSFSAKDIKEQGIFLDKLTQPVDGFLVLDLHNIYCQSENFGINMLDLIKSFPLDKVHEIHISGGSWQNSIYTKEIKKVRRDTHDDRVPEKLFRILPNVLKCCPNIEYIIFERLGNTLKKEEEQKQFRKDFLKLKTIALRFYPSNKKVSAANSCSIPYNKEPFSDIPLYKEQKIITSTLLNTDDPHNALLLLKQKELKFWDVSQWNPSMLETAIAISKKWD